MIPLFGRFLFTLTLWLLLLVGLQWLFPLPVSLATDTLCLLAVVHSMLRLALAVMVRDQRNTQAYLNRSAALALLLALPAVASADGFSSLRDVPQVDEDANSAPFAVTVSAGAQVTLTGDVDAKVTPTAWIEAEGPLVVGSLALARVGARLGLTSSPGQTIDVTDVQTYKAAEAAFNVSRIIGRMKAGEQTITTAVVLEAGFSSRLPGEPNAKERLTRHYGVGVRFAESATGASLTLLYGRDESAGDAGYGQVTVYGAVPIPATKGMLLLVGDATLGLASSDPKLQQRDVLRLGISTDLGRVLDVIR